MGTSSSKDGKPVLGKKSTTEDAALGADLSGQIAIVTGCSAGIGVATVTQLVKQGCTVIMANRNLEKSKTARNKVLQDLAAVSNSANKKTTERKTKSKTADTKTDEKNDTTTESKPDESDKPNELDNTEQTKTDETKEEKKEEKMIK